MAVKASGTGSFLIPTAPAVGTTVAGGAANTFTTNAVQLIASTGAAIFITGIHMQISVTSKPTYVVIRLSTGAGDGSIVGEFVVPYAYTAGATGTQMMGFVSIWPPIAVATATRIGAKTADSVGSLNHTVILQCINQSNVVAEGAIAETVDVLKWNGTAVSSPATAGIPDVNVKNIDNDAASASGTVTFPNATLASTTNITAATGVDITKILGTAISTPATAGILDVNVKNIDNDAASASGTVTFPNATLASTTNITAGTVTTATNVTTVNGLAANVITAASINADAITAAKVADDVSTEIANKVLDTDMTAHQTQGTLGQAIGDPVADTNTIYKAVVTDATGATVGVDVVAIQADTDNIQTRIPAALSANGNIKADIKEIEDQLTSGNNATLNLRKLNVVNDAGDALVAQSTGGDGNGMTIDGVGHGMQVSGIVDGIRAYSNSPTGGNGISSYGAGATGHGIDAQGDGGKSINAPQNIAASDGDLTLAAIAAAVWANATRTLTSFGTLVSDIWSNASRTLTAFAFSVTVGTNNDKTGYGLADGAITAAKIATDAIDADAIAADAVTEIQSGLSTLTAAGVRSAVGLATANLDTQLDALPTNAELATALGTADDATLAAIAALNNISAADILAAADATPIASNIKEVNDVTIIGDGSATPWGPV